MAKGSSIVSNAALSVAARTAGIVLAFFSLGMATRYLGAEAAGEYFTVIAYAGIFSVFADLGLYQTLLRDISRPGVKEEEIFSSFFSLRAVSLLVVLGLGAPLISFLLPYSTTVRMGILFGSGIFICLSLSSLFIAVFQKHLRMQTVAAGELVSRVVQAGLIYIFLHAGYGVLAALGATFAASAVQLCILAVSARSHFRYRLSFHAAPWKGILGVSYPIALSTIFSFIYFKVDSLMLSILKSAHDVGIYGLAYKMLEIIIAYPAIYVGLLVPVFARSFSENRDEFFSTSQEAFRVLTFIALPMLVGGVVLAPKIIPLFGAGFGESVRTLQILLFAATAIFFGTLYSNILIAINRQKTLAWIYFVGMALNIAANFYAIPRWSYIGAAATTVVTEVFIVIAIAASLGRTGLFAASFSYLPRAAIASALMGAMLVAFSQYSLLLLMPLGIAAYVAFSLLFNTLPRSLTVLAGRRLGAVEK